MFPITATYNLELFKAKVNTHFLVAEHEVRLWPSVRLFSIKKGKTFKLNKVSLLVQISANFIGIRNFLK